MGRDTTTLESADIYKILKALPHRYPFMLVYRIRDIDGDRSSVGIKNVTAAEPHFQGHFPDNPVMPGVLILEGMAQTAGALGIFARNDLNSPQILYLMTFDKVKFRKPVIPGDTIEYHITKLKSRRKMSWYRGEAKVGGVIVAEGEVSAMLVDR